MPLAENQHDEHKDQCPAASAPTSANEAPGSSASSRSRWRQPPGRPGSAAPPTMTISRASPEVTQFTSASVAIWNDHGLERTGQAGQGGRQHIGHQLVVVDAVTQRDGARLVVADGAQHLTERRIARCDRWPRNPRHDGQHHVVQRQVVAQRHETQQRPRGTSWMPSSPPVKGARSAMKYTSCAMASVIIENAVPMRRMASSP